MKRKYLVLLVKTSVPFELDEKVIIRKRRDDKSESKIAIIGEVVDFGCQPMPLEDICDD